MNRYGAATNIIMNGYVNNHMNNPIEKINKNDIIL